MSLLHTPIKNILSDGEKSTWNIRLELVLVILESNQWNKNGAVNVSSEKSYIQEWLIYM